MLIKAYLNDCSNKIEKLKVCLNNQGKALINNYECLIFSPFKTISNFIFFVMQQTFLNVN